MVGLEVGTNKFSWILHLLENQFLLFFTFWIFLFENFNPSNLCLCYKVVYACNHRNLRLSSRTRRVLKKLTVLSSFSSSPWSTSASTTTCEKKSESALQHLHMCLHAWFCLNSCLYLVGAAGQNLDIQALPLLGILLSLRVVHLLRIW